MALEVGGAFVDIVGALGIALLLYVLPGWALLAWLWPASSLSWVERLALSVGVSLALYPLLLLWTDAAGLHLGPLYAWLPVLLGGALLAWRYRRWRPRCGRDRLLRWWSSSARWPDIVMVLALLLVFGVRLVVVRTLEASIWDDAYQHTLITQLLVNNGGLFESWEPYAPYSTLTVHVGFH
ncbi:MAG: DUF1616 domain-containing protein, partial [Anaerolineae bacterium]|nr:DUF1616 domain-containing protein [Anaerolineae bacterium]